MQYAKKNVQIYPQIVFFFFNFVKTFFSVCPSVALKLSNQHVDNIEFVNNEHSILVEMQ